MGCKANAVWRVALALALGAGGAEALTYSWKPSMEAYVPVSGFPVTFSSADNAATFVTLPFTFSYDSLAYSGLAVSTNGMVSFGSSSTSAFNSDLFTAFSPFSVLAPWWDDQIDDLTATVQIFTEGLSPNRVFVIQYADYPDWATGSSLRLQYQVRLSEGTNRIQFVYGDKSAGTSHPSSSASIGIKGRNSLPGFFFDGTRGSRTTGLSNLTSATGFPAAGTSFTFAPDTVAPTGLVALPGNGRADLTWMKSRLPTLMRYRIYIGASPTTMALRDSTAALSDTTFTITGLVNGTTYYVGVTGVGPGLEESGFAQVVAVIPTQPPTVAVASPASGTVYPSTTASIPFTATASDLDGGIVRVEYYRGAFLIGSSTGANSYLVTWFSPVAGVHTVTAKAFDNSGASTVSAPITITVNAAPIVAMTGPVSGSRFNPGTLVTLSATASDGDGTVTVVEFLRGGVKIGEDSTSPYAYDWTAGPSGIHSITARAIDNNGEARVSSGIPVTVTLPPQVTLVTPTNGTVVNAGTAFLLSATATDNDGTVSRVEYYRGNTFIGSSSSGNPFSYNWPSAIAGTHSITARAFDNFGVADTSDPVTLVVNALPTVSVTAPATGTVILPGSDALLSATANDGDGTVSHVEFYRDGILIGDDPSAPYGLTWASPPSGRYLVTARAYDNLGAVGTSLSTVLIVTNPPTVAITAPAAGALVHTASGGITLTATASDGDGSVARVDFYWGTTLLGGTTVGNPFSFTWFPTTGSKTVTARATDNLGAIDTSDAVTFTVNTTPSVSLSSPFAGTYALGTTFNLAASASDGDGSVTRVEFFRDGIKMGEDSTSPYDGVAWTPTASGRYLLTARADDNRGGSGTSAAIAVTISAQPEVQFTDPVNGGAIAYPQTQLIATASDSDGSISRVDFYRGSSFVGSSTSGNPFSFNWTVPSTGTHTLIARAYDNNGLASLPDTVIVTTSSSPQVALTGPSHFSAFTTSSSIALTATASDADGSVSEVRFYRDSIFIGSSSGPSFGTTWTNVPPGRYRLQARAVDNQGLIGYSQGVTVFVNDSAKAVLGGRLFITGHDADDHSNYEFMSAALDYLMFGKAAGTPEMPIKKGARIAFLYDVKTLNAPILAYGMPTPINVGQAGWETLAFPTRPYDALMVGTGVDFVSSSGAAALNAQRAKFEDYFNHGGGILASSEQGVGQPYYNFLPAFGSAVQQNIGDVSGAFTATPAGLAIGLTEAIVDRDLTHTEFNNVDTAVFRIFEYYNLDLKPVSIGANAIIEGNIFVPKDSVVEDPQAFSRDSVFLDTLCIRFESPTPGALLHLTRDGGSPDTTSWILPNGSSVCIDNSTLFRVLAKKPGWVNSANKEFRFRRADQVDMPRPDSLPGYFRDRICVRFTSATPDAQIRYTLDGGQPDTSGLYMPNGDPVCLDATGVIRVLGRKTGMRDSDTASYVYTRMEKTATPALNKPDSTWFPDSLCFRFSAGTPGSHIHYTLDGGDPDTAETHAHDGDSLCVDRSVTVRLIAEKPNFIPSDENTYRYFKMDRVAAPISNRGDSTWFRDTLCLVLTTATPGAAIHYTLNGPPPDSSSPVAPASGLCVDGTTWLQAIAVLRNWINSPVSSYDYPRMDTLARPTANPPDSTGFAGSLCVRFSTNSEGATLRYSLDGTDPAGSTLTMPMSDSLCFDRAVVIRAQAEKANWVPSPQDTFTYRLMQRVARPTASRSDSTWFADTLCVRFATATDSATLHYLLGPGRADTSSLTIPSGRNLCVDRSIEVRVAATRPSWLPSEELVLRFLKMDTASVPTADPGDSTWFAGRQCIRLTTSTPGASIRYTRDGGDPAITGSSLASGDTVCVEDTTTIRALARKQDWVDSRVAVFHYLRMQKVATPVADRRDSTYFADSLCVRFTTATPGATLRYTADGSQPDTASVVLPVPGALCVDSTAVLRVIATKERWIPSDPVQVRALKMDTVAKPVPDPGDSTYFPQSLCVRWTVATPGAVIRVTADGSPPDSASRTLASGDTLCLDRTATVRAVGAKPDWIPSPDTAATYLRMLRAAKPEPDKADSLYFADRLCIRYASATQGVRIRYTLNGGRADTSGLSIANGDTLCVDRSVRIKAVAARENWITSEESVLQVFRMETVAVPETGVPDSTWFRDSLCVPWTTATAGAAITVRRTPPDSGGISGSAETDGSGKLLVSGDSVCLDRSATLRAVGSLKNWKDSPEAVRRYFRMDTVAKPVFDRRDTLFYPSICVKVSMPTPGADIRYTLDGGDPDTSRLVKRGGDTICTDRSVTIRAVGERIHSVPSEEAALKLTRMAQVASLRTSIGDSTVFSRRICFTLSSSTDSVRIRYTLGGRNPLDDTLSMANGDSLCLDRSAEVVAVGTRPGWRNSEPIRISLEVDNDGPRVVSAEKRPYDIRTASVTGNCRGIGQDTLVATFSERLFPKSKPPRWDRLLVFAPSCDSGQVLPVLSLGAPVISGDGLKATFLLDNAAPDEKPKLGNCLSLDWRSGEFPDRVGNLPERHGIRIEGRENAVRISQIRAYPPVVGLDDAGTSGGCSDERVEVNTWIPPVGFDIVRGDIDPGSVRNCQERGGENSGRRTAIPPCLSIVEVVSDGPYVADINIFDNLGNFIHGSRQGFGACGELDNLDRSVGGKQRSYLVWNSRDRTGSRAGNGVYVWRIAFHSEKHGLRGTQTVMLRTGFLRSGACAE